MMVSIMFASATGGCIDTDIADTDPVGSVEQHFTGGYLQWLFVTQNAQAELGSATTFTPFLNSVSGNLASAGSVAVHAGGEDPSIDKNWLYVLPSPGTGTRLGGGGSSVNSVANRILPIQIGNNTSGSQSKNLGLTTAHRRCFLTAVWNAPSYEAFRDSTDLVQVMTNGSNWVINATGHVLAAAGCADVTTYLGQASWSGEGTIDLGPTGGGKSCFLTAVGGAFRTNDWNDGVVISVNAGHWQMKVSAGKTGTAECDI